MDSFKSETPLLSHSLDELHRLVTDIVNAHAAGSAIDTLDLERIGQIVGQRSLRAAIMEHNAGSRSVAPMPLPDEQRLLVETLQRQSAQLANLGATGNGLVDVLVREVLARVQRAPHRVNPEHLARLDEVSGQLSGRALLVVQLARQLCFLGERLAQRMEAVARQRGETMPLSPSVEASAAWLAVRLAET